MLLNLFFILMGFILLIKGADFLVDGASSVAKKMHVPEIVIGLTIISIGTSMPELVVSVESSIKGYSNISIGNVIGSNIINMYLILGVCAIISPLYFKIETRIFENPYATLVTTILFIMCKTGKYENSISRVEGITLLVFCLIFFIYNVIMAKKGENFDRLDNEDKELRIKKEISIAKSIVYILLGIIGLKIGGDFVVEGASKIGIEIGISEKIVSLTIVSFSTSLPEFITSIIATKKGEKDIAIGNVLGSQILNILLIIGISATLKPIPYSNEYDNDLVILIIGTFIVSLFPYIGEKNKMSKRNGIAFFATYVIYIINLIIV